jgi:catechol 2,3-dioxygenase-like lactoylglutathione lyase family enzyme
VRFHVRWVGYTPGVRPQRLDHVAVYVSDPDKVAALLLAQLPFRELERTDEFVLVGRAQELGKLTLFEAPAPRDRGALLRIGIGIPCGMVERTLDLGDDAELEVVLVPADPDGEVDLCEVALATPDPEPSARRWLELGFEPEPRSARGVTRVRLGDAFLELYQRPSAATARPLLNHLGLLVESVDELEDERLEVIRTVDAENSRAVFVQGPDGVEVEFIEHKPSFALA